MPPMSLRSALAIMAGGACGALARAGLATTFPAAAGHWPWATFAANQVGVLVLAWMSARSQDGGMPVRLWQPMLGPGFCGALTTFSAFQLETIELARHDRLGLGVAYAIVSLAVGMACAAAGARYAGRRRHG